MAGNPRTVAADTWFTWDGVSQRLPRGQVLDVTPGSALERAIGKDKLVPLGAVSRPPAAEAPQPEPAPRQEPPATPARPRPATAKKQDSDGKDGDA